MIYREAGDFKTSYAADGQTFPIAFDRWRYRAVMALAFLVVPFVIDGYWLNAILLPFLIWSIAAIGLNILTGYCGQVSLGTGGFMAVGAFASFKLMTAFPELNVAFAVLGGGVIDGAGRHGLRPAEPADQGLLPRRRHPRRAVLPGLAVQQGAVVHELLGDRPDQRAGPQRLRLGRHRRRRHPGGEVPVLPRHPLRRSPGPRAT